MAKIGERVETPCGFGRVLFCGKTDFADGDWVGVELDEPGEQRALPFSPRARATLRNAKYLTCGARVVRWQARRRSCRQEILFY